MATPDTPGDCEVGVPDRSGATATHRVRRVWLAVATVAAFTWVVVSSGGEVPHSQRSHGGASGPPDAPKKQENGHSEEDLPAAACEDAPSWVHPFSDSSCADYAAHLGTEYMDDVCKALPAIKYFTLDGSSWPRVRYHCRRTCNTCGEDLEDEMRAACPPVALPARLYSWAMGLAGRKVPADCTFSDAH